MIKAKIFKSLLCFSSIIAVFTSCSNNEQTNSDSQITSDETTFSNLIISDETTQMTVQTTSEQTSVTTVQAVTTSITQKSISTSVEASQTEQAVTSEMITAQTTAESSAALTSDTVAQKEYPPLVSLTDDEISELKEDFAEFNPQKWKQSDADDMTIIKYYGKYNDCEAVTMYSMEYPVTDDIKYLTVGNCTIELGSGDYDIYLHIGHDFIDIQTAYESGYLNDEDIAAMYYYSNHR